MRLAVISHKPVWRSDLSPSRFSTDGGFPFQMRAISELFETTTLVVPCAEEQNMQGLTPLRGKDLDVMPLSSLKGHGFKRKLGIPVWLIKNGSRIWREVRLADAVHAPIPGDVGTIGMLFALLLRKPLFVRHCGNWFVQRTAAEKFWKASMEFFGGGRNVMLVTGGSDDEPSRRNKNIRWIFSTSLTREQIALSKSRTLPDDGRLRLVIACRQEARKGTDVVIKSLPHILKAFPNASLDVIGDGSRLPELRALAESLAVNGSIKFHGKLEHSDVLSILRQGHIFCYPTDASEGFPKAVLEALAAGLPVITTRVSVLPKLIGSGGGRLINSPSAPDLASAVTEICSDKDKYREMSGKAIETAHQYSLEEWQHRIGEILRNSWGVESLQDDSCP